MSMNGPSGWFRVHKSQCPPHGVRLEPWQECYLCQQPLGLFCCSSLWRLYYTFKNSRQTLQWSKANPAMSGQKSTKFSSWTVSYGSFWTRWQLWTIHSGDPDKNINSSGRNRKCSSHTVTSCFLIITIWLWSDTPFDLVQKPWVCRESSTLSWIQSCMHLSQGM